MDASFKLNGFESMIEDIHHWNVKVYNDGVERETIRGLTLAQMNATLTAFDRNGVQAQAMAYDEAGEYVRGHSESVNWSSEDAEAGQSVSPGDKITYHHLHGDKLHRAIVTSVREDGYVDLVTGTEGELSDVLKVPPTEPGQSHGWTPGWPTSGGDSDGE